MVSRTTRDLTTVEIMGGLFAGLVGFILVADIIISRANRRLREREMEAARLVYLQESGKRIVAAQESLRREIAQQLHGSVQNRLIFLILRLKELIKLAPAGELSQELADLGQKFEELVEKEIRPIAYQLYPYILRRGVIPALQSLGDQFEATMAIEMDLDQALILREKADPNFVPEQVRLAAYRIAEEAMTNAAKHSGASKVTVRLEQSSEGWMSMTVRDDGTGFDSDGAPGGLGIVGMRDYAEVMGGACVVRGRDGSGTEVRVTLPLAAPDGRLPETGPSLE